MGGAPCSSVPESARWNADKQVVEFSVGVGEYSVAVGVPRHVCRRFIDDATTLEDYLEAPSGSCEPEADR